MTPLKSTTGRVLAGLLLSLTVGCGAPADEAPVAIELALSAGLTTQIATLQLAFVKSGTVDCESVLARCLRDQGLETQPVGGPQAGRPVHSEAFLGVDQTFEVVVAPGSYLVLVEALDASGGLVANACRLRLELKSNETASATFALVGYGGSTCRAAFP